MNLAGFASLLSSGEKINGFPPQIQRQPSDHLILVQRAGHRPSSSNINVEILR